MKNTLALLPVDARPVTYDLPKDLAKLAGWKLLTPDKEDLGYLKEPANFTKLFAWIDKIASEVDGIIVSMDMLLYGGLVPSRVNNDRAEIIEERLNKLKQLKRDYPKLKIMAFSSVMRLSNSYVNEEEKDYWSEYGKEIWTYSFYHHKYMKYGILEDKDMMTKMRSKIPEEILQDYKQTRKRHFQMNKSFVNLLIDGLFDLLVFPQDDTSEFGLNIYEQEQLHQLVHEQKLYEQVLIYPGADEVASVLLSRMIYALEKMPLPKFYPIYSGVSGSLSIARYEDRSLQESVKGQIEAFGSHTVEETRNAEIILGVNVPGEVQGDHALQEQLNRVDTNDRNVGEWIRKLHYYYEQKKHIAIADVAYANGADEAMVSQLLSKFTIQQLSGFAGWNTAGNTIGTVIAQSSLIHLAKEKGLANNRLQEIQLMLRFLDDYLYQAIVRQEVRQEIDEEGSNSNQLLKKVHELYIHQAEEFIRMTGSNIEIKRVYLPWQRTFEIGIELK